MSLIKETFTEVSEFLHRVMRADTKQRRGSSDVYTNTGLRVLV